ncbi:MAG: hypothetical protein AAGB31_11465, partial [Bdellovibrio sp.]
MSSQHRSRERLWQILSLLGLILCGLLLVSDDWFNHFFSATDSASSHSNRSSYLWTRQSPSGVVSAAMEAQPLVGPLVYTDQL